MPLLYWEDAFTTAIFLINRLPTPILNNLSPSEMLYNRVPDFSFLRVFGCACWPNLRPYNRHKLDFRSKSYIFIGYSVNHHGYKCLDLSTGRVYVSRHVVFDETMFPYQAHLSSNMSLNSNSSTHVTLPSHLPIPLSASFTDMQIPSLPFTTNAYVPLVSPSAGTNDEPHVRHATSISSTDIVDADQSISSDQPETPLEPILTPQVMHDTTSNHPMITRSRNNIFKPKATSDDFVRYPLPTALLTSLHSSGIEPTCYSEAIKSPQWRKAMNAEFDALLRNGTWSLVPPPPQANIVGCRWIYKIKKHVDGSIERFKARLVAKGFHQQEGIDFNETFSHVVKHATIRIVLSLAISYNWQIKQIDIQNAFLHGALEVEVYMAQPQGYIHPEYPNHLCRLHKSIYGLKQAPRAWFSRLTDKLRIIGFSASKADPSLFIWNRNNVLVVVLIYVDDIIITSCSSTAIDHVLKDLHSDFVVKELGDLSYFLGVEVLRSSDGMYLTQRKYVAELLKRTHMAEAKPCKSPMSTTCHLSATEGAKFSDPSLYRQVVGSLQYLAFTRPDLSFSIHKVSKFMHNPLEPHWQAVKRILRYLKHTISTGLFLHKSPTSAIQAFSDSDWAGDRDDRRSIGAYCIFMGTNLISWRCKQQLTVARSSTEAEYKSLADTASELQWLQSLFSELGLKFSTPPVLWCDNIGATYLTANPVFHARTKHIEIDFHYVRDQVHRKQLTVQFISSKDQLADSLTKPVSPPKFQHILANLNVRVLPFRLRGRVEEDMELLSNQVIVAINKRRIRRKIKKTN